MVNILIYFYKFWDRVSLNYPDLLWTCDSLASGSWVAGLQASGRCIFYLTFIHVKYNFIASNWGKSYTKSIAQYAQIVDLSLVGYIWGGGEL